MSEHPSWLHWVKTCPSTNTWAIDHAAQLIHGDVVYTPEQTAGRGQYGRTWQSPSGVLTASFVLDRFPVERLSGLSLVVGLAVIEAIETLLPQLQDQLKLKWPNDIWLQERKLAGILCEASLSANAVMTRVIVGIGINCQAVLDPANLTYPAISLHEICTEVPNPQPILESIRHYLLHFSQAIWFPVQATNLEIFLPMLESRDALKGRLLTIEVGNQQLTGESIGIDGNGQIQIKFSNGETRSIPSGRIIRLN